MTYVKFARSWKANHEISVGRCGEPEDIASRVCFLASPLAAYITDTVIAVDGGLRRYRFEPGRERNQGPMRQQDHPSL